MPGHERWLVFYEPRYRWMPRYKAGDGKKSYVLNSVQVDECPAGFVRPAAARLVQIEVENMLVKENSGAALYGPDSNRWPAWWWDVLITCAEQRALQRNAANQTK